MSAELANESALDHVMPQAGEVRFINEQARDWQLELDYGHYAPDELLDLSITNKDKARVAQLQIAALYLVSHEVEEASDWIAFYQKVTDQTPMGDPPDLYI